MCSYITEKQLKNRLHARSISISVVFNSEMTHFKGLNSHVVNVILDVFLLCAVVNECMFKQK